MFFFQKNHFPSVIRGQRRKFFRSLAKNFSPVLSLMHSLHAEEQFGKNEFHEKKFNFKSFADIEGSVISFLSKFFRESFSRILSMCPEKPLKETTFVISFVFQSFRTFVDINFCHFWTLEQK